MSGKAGSRKHKGGHDEEHESHERWLVTYADMLTLLMVLFIVLFAIGQVDQKKFMAFKAGLSKSLGDKVQLLDGSSGLLDDAAIKPSTSNFDVNVNPSTSAQTLTPAQQATARKAALAAAQRELDSMGKARKAILAALHKGHLDGAVRFSVDDRGMEVSIVTDKVLFPADLAVLQPFGKRVLDAVAPALRALPNNLLVEGHTNTARVKPRFYPSEWELSSARAVTVLRYLIDAHRMAPKRLAATGYADQHPLYAGDGPEANLLNRRVDIVVASGLAADRRSLLPLLARTWPATR
jgi:chemotaxis protein MotB